MPALLRVRCNNSDALVRPIDSDDEWTEVECDKYGTWCALMHDGQQMPLCDTCFARWIKLGRSGIEAARRIT